MAPHTVAVSGHQLKILILIKKNALCQFLWLIVSCIFKMGCLVLGVFCNHFLTLTAHFKPKTNQYLQQPMTLCREKAAPLRNFKVISDLTKVFSLFHDHYPQGMLNMYWPESVGALWPSKDFMAWWMTRYEILPVQLLGKSYIEIALKRHNLTRQAFVFFYSVLQKVRSAVT